MFGLDPLSRAVVFSLLVLAAVTVAARLIGRLRATGTAPFTRFVLLIGLALCGLVATVSVLTVLGTGVWIVLGVAVWAAFLGGHRWMSMRSRPAPATR